MSQEELLRISANTIRNLRVYNAMLKELLEQAIKRCGEIGVERDVAIGENAKLKELLRDYGSHRDGCPGRFSPHKCTCGWDREKDTMERNNEDGL